MISQERLLPSVRYSILCGWLGLLASPRRLEGFYLVLSPTLPPLPHPPTPPWTTLLSNFISHAYTLNNSLPPTPPPLASSPLHPRTSSPPFYLFSPCFPSSSPCLSSGLRSHYLSTVEHVSPDLYVTLELEFQAITEWAVKHLRSCVWESELALAQLNNSTAPDGKLSSTRCNVKWHHV